MVPAVLPEPGWPYLSYERSPNCTISCVHQVSYIDHWRAPQKSFTTPGGAAHGAGAELVQIQ